MSTNQKKVSTVEMGNVLNGASNEDLKVLAECQDAVGDVMHTKKWMMETTSSR